MTIFASAADLLVQLLCEFGCHLPWNKIMVHNGRSYRVTVAELDPLPPLYMVGAEHEIKVPEYTEEVSR